MQLRSLIQRILRPNNINDGVYEESQKSRTHSYTPKPEVFLLEETDVSSNERKSMSRFNKLVWKSSWGSQTEKNVHVEGLDPFTQQGIRVNPTARIFNDNSGTYRVSRGSPSLPDSLPSNSNIRWTQKHRLNIKEKDNTEQKVVIPSTPSTPFLHQPFVILNSLNTSANLLSMKNAPNNDAGVAKPPQQHERPRQDLASWGNTPPKEENGGQSTITGQSVLGTVQEYEYVHTSSQRAGGRAQFRENALFHQPFDDSFILHSDVDEGVKQTKTTLLDYIGIWEGINKATRRREDLERRQEAEERDNMRRKEVEWVKEAAVTTEQYVTGSYVRFNAGLNIQRIICGADASRIILKNLPPNGTPSDILELFTQQGVAEEDLAILRMEMVDGFQEATILGRAVEVDTVALRDRSIRFTISEQPSEYDDCCMKPVNGQGPYIRMSWKRQESLRTMVITYDPLHVQPEKILKNLLEGITPNLGVVLEHNPAHNLIKVSRVPAHLITLSDIRVLAGAAADPQALNSCLMPYSQTFQKPGNSQISYLIEPKPNVDYDIVSVKVTLGSWDDAQFVHDRLTTGHLPFVLPSLFVEIGSSRPLYNFIVTLQGRQYHAQRVQWTDLYHMKDGENVWMDIVEIDSQVNISLLGNDKKAVGSMKVRIENLARGHKLDKKYWHYHFSSEDGKNFINDLFESTGAYIRCDDDQRCLSVYGTTEAVELAKREITDEVARLNVKQYIIPLDSYDHGGLGTFCNGGVDRLRGLFENGNVSLDIPNARLILTNIDLEEAIHCVKGIVTVGNNAATSNELYSYEICPVCSDFVTQPIQLACQHLYCSSCLRHYLISCLENRDIPLKCIGGDKADCGSPFSIPLIKRFIPTHLFERLLEVAFLAHIEQHPREFKACPTPDCPQIYRATLHENELECHSCFNTICSRCHESFHVGLTCSEREAQKELVKQDRLYQSWAIENDVKQCGACGARIQKAEGCNHITCKCGAHICWICMEIFSKIEIYPHLARVHKWG